MSKPYRPLKPSEPNSSILPLHPHYPTKEEEAIWAVYSESNIPFRTTRHELEHLNRRCDWVEYQTDYSEIEDDIKIYIQKTIKQIRESADRQIDDLLKFSESL